MAPATLGTQNQIVDFILADPELRETIARWGRTVETDEATTGPPRRLPDAAYRRIRDFAQARMDQPVFMRPGQEPRDRKAGHVTITASHAHRQDPYPSLQQ